MNKRPHIYLQCTSSKHRGPFHSGFRQNDKDPLRTCCSMSVSVEQRFLTYVQKTNKNLSAWYGCTNNTLYLKFKFKIILKLVDDITQPFSVRFIQPFFRNS